MCYKKIKIFLSQILIAIKKNKYTTTILVNSQETALLDLFWKAGFIYGYKLHNFKVTIFFKPTSFNEFTQIVFFKGICTDLKVLNNTMFLNPISIHLVITSTGLIMTRHNKNKVGGRLLCRLV